MMAILRYAFLKSWRDRSLVAFMIWPPLMSIGPWVAITLERRAGHGGPSPREIAEMSAMIGGMVSISLASMFAFWTFRGEIATRSIGAFLFAARPLSVIAALIIFATAGGLGSALLAEGSLTVLVGGPPSSQFGSLALHVFAGSFFAAALGALAVTISAQPTMMIGALWGTYALVAIPEIIRDAGAHHRFGGQFPPLSEYVVWLAVAIVSAGLAAILLRRRCAT